MLQESDRAIPVNFEPLPDEGLKFKLDIHEDQYIDC